MSTFCEIKEIIRKQCKDIKDFMSLTFLGIIRSKTLVTINFTLTSTIKDSRLNPLTHDRPDPDNTWVNTRIPVGISLPTTVRTNVIRLLTWLKVVYLASLKA